MTIATSPLSTSWSDKVAYLNRGIKDLQLCPPSTIHKCVNSLVRLWDDIFDIDAWHINCGDCEDFACNLVEIWGDGAVFWGEEFIVPDSFLQDELCGHHAFARIKDKYYDSECPRGVRCWTQLPCFKRLWVRHPLYARELKKLGYQSRIS